MLLVGGGAAGDQQHRRGGGGGHRVAERDRLIGRGEQIGQLVGEPFDPLLGRSPPAVALRQPRLVLRRAAGGPLGDHRGDARVGGGRPHRLLPTHRHADHGDAVLVHLRSRHQVVHRGHHVEVAVPTEVHGPTTAGAVAAGVEGEHAVPLAHQHSGLVEHARPGGPGAVQQHHGRRLVARDPPRRQHHAVGRDHLHVGGRQAHVGRRGTQPGGGHVGGGHGGADHREADREHHHQGGHGQQPPPPGREAHERPRPRPQEQHAPRQQHGAGRGDQGGAPLGQVGQRDAHRGTEGHAPRGEGRRGSGPLPAGADQPPDRPDQQGEAHDPSDLPARRAVPTEEAGPGDDQRPRPDHGCPRTTSGAAGRRRIGGPVIGFDGGGHGARSWTARGARVRCSRHDARPGLGRQGPEVPGRQDGDPSTRGEPR